MARPWRRLLPLVVLVGAVALAACDPPPPPLVLRVAVSADGSDATPGDGVCEVTGGEGDCTLRAAIEEANASSSPASPTRIEVVEEQGRITAYVGGDIDVTGSMRIVDVGTMPPAASTEGILLGGTVHVATGARLDVVGAKVATQGTPTGDAIDVAGSLTLDRVTHLLGGSGAIHVRPGGQAVAVDTWITGISVSAIDNDGVAVLESVTAASLLGPHVISTGPGATTLVRGTAIIAPGSGRLPPGRSPACTGAPLLSLGSNAAWDGTCGGLTGADDIADLPGLLPPVDTIPVGVGGCGASGDVDRFDRARPADGDGDGIARCDIGADEGPLP